MPSPKKILFAAVDVGFRIELYSKFILKNFSHKLQPESLCIYKVPEQHYKTSYTYEYNFYERNSLYRYIRSIFNFIFCLFRFDIFHFISGETLLTRRLRGFELWIYKLFGKRIIMQFVGSDIRDEDYVLWKKNNMVEFLNGQQNFNKSKVWQKKLIKHAEKYADYILVSTPDLIELIPRAEYYPVLLDIDKFTTELDALPLHLKKKTEITILHSPSSFKYTLKGSDVIGDVLRKIVSQDKYNIQLILPGEKVKDRITNYSATRYEMFEHYRKADIVIDQLITGWYGLISVETLAAKKQAVCYVDKHLEHYLYPDCPIALADITNLENVLIQNIEKHITGVNNERYLMWVKKYHTIENNHSALLRAWNVSPQN